MLVWATTFLIAGIIAGIFGFSGVAGTATWIAQLLFFLFFAAFVISFFRDRRHPQTRV